MTISYLPMIRDYTVFVGATFSHSFHWTSGGLDVDLSGWDAWMPYGSSVSTSLGELSVAAGSIILTSEGGIKLYLTDEQTEEMFGDPEHFPTVRGVKTLVYQLSLENELGEVIRFMRGNLYLQYDVKRPGPPAPPSGTDVDFGDDGADSAAFSDDDIVLEILDPGHMTSDDDGTMLEEDIVVTESGERTLSDGDEMLVEDDLEISVPEPPAPYDDDETVISDDVVVTDES